MTFILWCDITCVTFDVVSKINEAEHKIVDTCLPKGATVQKRYWN